MPSENILLGLTLPPKLKGAPGPELIEPWLNVVEELMGRGVRTPSELKKVLGIESDSAKKWMREVRKRWMHGLTDDKINWRRETLYAEADAVSRAAWFDSMGDDVTPSQKASLYKIILLANQRKASLTGLDAIEVRIKKEIKTHTIVDMVTRVETEHGLAPGALGAIGTQAANALSGSTLAPPIEAEIIETKTTEARAPAKAKSKKVRQDEVHELNAQDNAEMLFFGESAFANE